MPPTMFQLNPTYGSGDVKNVKSSRWVKKKKKKKKKKVQD